MNIATVSSVTIESKIFDINHYACVIFDARWNAQPVREALTQRQDLVFMPVRSDNCMNARHVHDWCPDFLFWWYYDVMWWLITNKHLHRTKIFISLIMLEVNENYYELYRITGSKIVYIYIKRMYILKKIHQMGSISYSNYANYILSSIINDEAIISLLQNHEIGKRTKNMNFTLKCIYETFHEKCLEIIHCFRCAEII